MDCCLKMKQGNRIHLTRQCKCETQGVQSHRIGLFRGQFNKTEKAIYKGSDNKGDTK